MALPDLHPSPQEIFWIWVRRIFGTLALLLLQALVYFQLLFRLPMWAGLVVAPLLALFTWQLVSRLVTGQRFSFSIRVMVESPRQLADLLFTVACGINALLVVYNFLSWYR